MGGSNVLSNEEVRLYRRMSPCSPRVVFLEPNAALHASLQRRAISAALVGPIFLASALCPRNGWLPMYAFSPDRLQDKTLAGMVPKAALVALDELSSFDRKATFQGMKGILGGSNPRWPCAGHNCSASAAELLTPYLATLQVRCQTA